jgi:hypothetical protein
MRILFERFGGVMGLRSGLLITLKDLPPEQAETLRKLLDDANFFTLPQSQPVGAGPDGFQYTITVETELVKHTIHTSDTTASKELQPLLQELTRRMRLQRKP